MKRSKNMTIRKRIQIMVMIIITTALVTTSVVTVVGMTRIRNQTQEVLISRMEHNLLNIVTNKAELADAHFKRYADYVSTFSNYIHDLYLHRGRYALREVMPPSAKDGNALTMKRYIASEDIPYEDLYAECSCLGNVEQVFSSVMKDNEKDIFAIYLSTETGLQISCDRDSTLTANVDGSEVYYDYFDRPWYDLAKEKGGVCFTNVYMDSYNRGYMITCAAPFYDARGYFAGVVCMDLLVDNVYDSIVDFDILDGDEDYAFLIDGNGYAVSPLYSEMNVKEDEEIGPELAGKIMSGETGVSFSKSGCYYGYAPIESVDWKLCLHVPQSMVLEPVTEIEQKIGKIFFWILMAFVLVTALAFVMARFFSRGITGPLEVLRQDALEISNSNLDHEAKVCRNDEIGELAEGFNHMAVSLKDYIKDLTEITAEKERIGAELNVATKIQADMLPRNFMKDRKEFDLYATMTPAKEVGGDFYDFFFTDETHLCMVMADVSGKGVPAALFMVIAKTLIKNRATQGQSPSQILAYANEQLCKGNEAELFVTVWIAIVDLVTGKGVAANAGHEHPVLRRKDGDYELVEYRHSPAVATIEGLSYKEHEFELHPGDSLFVYTDGVPEAADHENRFYGTERLLKVLNKNKESSSEDTLHEIKADIDGFVGDSPQFDDITMLIFNYYGEKGRL
ncbi:MAG: SpoIIE family protein phosphatase [Butyrivibrio sp.]|nr:SpoIIE family protein phosphatase [Butyrivibrio sp.]